MYEDMALSDVISSLAANIDVTTQELLTENRTLILVGGDTPTLRLVREKALSIGMTVANLDEVPEVIKHPIIVDVHYYKKPLMLTPEYDIDCVANPGMSICAHAISLLFSMRKDLQEKNVTLIGRGRYIKGLTYELVYSHNCTVNVCHEYTKDLRYATINADIIINASLQTGPFVPKWNTLGKTPHKTICFDVARTLPNLNNRNMCDEYVSNVDELALSILMGRAVSVNPLFNIPMWRYRDHWTAMFSHESYLRP